MQEIDPNSIPIPELHRIILGAVAPRPIAFASTVDKAGNHNLSPFSFFNAFGVNPTTLIFSPSRRGRDNTTKHTYENILEVPEVVINTVSYAMVEQMSLSSTEYPKGEDEFIKSGLTPVASVKVQPMRVKESPVSFECKVREVIETGTGGGAGNLIICEILYIHVADGLLDAKGLIDPDRIDLVGRLGGDYYCRTSGDSKFIVRKPLQRLGIGVDRLPEAIRLSPWLSGNHLGKLGNTEHFPTPSEIKACESDPTYRNIVGTHSSEILEHEIHLYAGRLLDQGNVEEAFAVLMAFHTFG